MIDGKTKMKYPEALAGPAGNRTVPDGNRGSAEDSARTLPSTTFRLNS
jgi:hypothetical protein